MLDNGKIRAAQSKLFSKTGPGLAAAWLPPSNGHLGEPLSAYGTGRGGRTLLPAKALEPSNGFVSNKKKTQQQLRPWVGNAVLGKLIRTLQKATFARMRAQNTSLTSVWFLGAINHAKAKYG